MKVKLTQEMIDSIVNNPEAAKQAGIKISDPWWMILAKVIKYLCELIIAGGAAYIAMSCTVL